jgi:AcrR family transcriptional regulator
MTITSKEALQNIAVNLFVSKGFKETSIGDIEEAAGLKRRAGGFYRHFKSKEAVLHDGLQGMVSAIVAETALDEVLAQPDVRGELLYIANRLLDHSAEFRMLRLLLQREAHKLPELRKMLHASNLKLVQQDLIPWMTHAMRRAGRTEDVRAFALLVFGPVLAYLVSLDRNRPAFDLEQDGMLDVWADFWAPQLAARE